MATNLYVSESLCYFVSASIDRGAADYSVEGAATKVFNSEAVWAAADEVFRTALALEGTLTGEHGVGVLKRRWLALELGPEVMDVHRSIKTALDPAGILNPGKGY